MFLQEKGKELLKKNLYRNFVLHMCTLFDFGLVSPVTVFTTMQKLQEIIQTDEEINKYVYHFFYSDLFIYVSSLLFSLYLFQAWDQAKNTLNGFRAHSL